jgi:hypothetical protein
MKLQLLEASGSVVAHVCHVHGPFSQYLLKALGDVLAEQGSISKAAFVQSAYQEVSCALKRKSGLLYGKWLFNTTRAFGRQCMAELNAPVIKACL